MAEVTELPVTRTSSVKVCIQEPKQLCFSNFEITYSVKFGFPCQVFYYRGGRES